MSSIEHALNELISDLISERGGCDENEVERLVEMHIVNALGQFYIDSSCRTAERFQAAVEMVIHHWIDTVDGNRIIEQIVVGWLDRKCQETWTTQVGVMLAQHVLAHGDLAVPGANNGTTG